MIKKKYEKACLILGISSTVSCAGLYIFEKKAWISCFLATSLMNGAMLEITDEGMLLNQQRISVSADDNHIN